jgi:hypothetical protein
MIHGAYGVGNPIIDTHILFGGGFIPLIYSVCWVYYIDHET